MREHFYHQFIPSLNYSQYTEWFLFHVKGHMKGVYAYKGRHVKGVYALKGRHVRGVYAMKGRLYLNFSKYYHLPS